MCSLITKNQIVLTCSMLYQPSPPTQSFTILSHSPSGTNSRMRTALLGKMGSLGCWRPSKFHLVSNYFHALIKDSSGMRSKRKEKGTGQTRTTVLLRKPPKDEAALHIGQEM